MRSLKSLIVLLFLAIASIESARILGVFPIPSRSHAILGHPIFVELAKRGHEVTFISPYPLKNPPNRYRDIVITEKGLFEIFDRQISQAFEKIDSNPLLEIIEGFEYLRNMSEYAIMDKAVQALLNDKAEQFDLVFIDTLLSKLNLLLANINKTWNLNYTDEALLGFGAHYEAKIIGISTFGHIHYVNDMMHNPMPFSLIPHPFSGWPDRMTFFQRAANTFVSTAERILVNLIHYPIQVSES